MRKVIALLLVASAIVTVLFLNVDKKNQSANDYVAMIKKCTSKVNMDIPEQDAIEASAIDCVSLVLEDAIRNEKARAVMPFLKEMNKKSGFARICHIASHRAGIKAFNKNESLIKQHDNVNSITCDSGMYHGFWEAVGYSKPSLEVWTELTSWCESQGNIVSDAGNCGDAAGHAAYDATKDQHAAVDLVCYLFSADVLISECVEGVLMQRFIPGSGSPGDDPLPPLDQLHELCSVLKDKKQSIAKGCFKGVGWLLAQKAKPDNEKLLSESVKVAEYTCALLGRGKNDCADRFYETMKTRTFIKSQLNEGVCNERDEYFYRKCKDFVTFVNANM